MAELKRNFLKSRMNKDLDERLIPEGEYREALNVEISTSEDADAGTAQTLKGNKVWDETYYQKGSYNTSSDLSYKSAKTVGTYVNKENSHIYNFVCDAQDLGTASFGVANYSNKYGYKSDRIEQIKPHATKSNLTQTKIVFNDVYEVRKYNQTESIDNKSFEFVGKSEKWTVGCGIQIDSFWNIKVGMRVQAIAPNGSDIYGPDNEIYVKSITKISDNPSLWRINITPLGDRLLALSQANIDAGVVLKFTSPRILNFSKGPSQEQELNFNNNVSYTPKSSIITGINVIDDFLFFTDGKNEPKKINIKRSIDGTVQNSDGKNIPHTVLVVDYKNKKQIPCFVKEEHVTVIKKNPLKAIKVEPGRNNVAQSIQNVSVTGTYDPELDFGNFSLYYLGEFITPESNVEQATNLYVKFNIDVSEVLEVGSIVTLTGATNAISIKFNVVSLPQNGIDYYTLNLRSELPDDYTGGDTPVVPSSESWTATIDNKDPLYENDFLRFAYRYKYVDGEISCISPYSNPAFVPAVYSYSSKNGYNFGIENHLAQIILSDYIEPNIPKDVVEVELIFKSQKTNNFYSFKTISRNELALSYALNMLYDLKQEYIDYFNTDNIVIKERLSGHTIPSDQIDRIFDDVPKKAVAQEVQSNRLMFGNYTQDYNLIDNSGYYINPNINSWIKSSNSSFGSSWDSTNIAKLSLVSDPAGVYIAKVYAGSTSLRYNDFKQFIFGINKLEEISDSGNNALNGSYTAPVDGWYTVSATANMVRRYRATALSNFSNYKTKLCILKIDNTGDVVNPIPIPFNAPQTNWSTDANKEIPATQIYLTAGEIIRPISISEDDDSYYLNTSFSIYSAEFNVLEAPYVASNIPSLVGKPSIKSMRSYDLGVVYRDDYGRESRVIISDDQRFEIPKSASSYSNRILAEIKHKAPYWAKTYKFFIKEDSSRFYNLVMEAAFLPSDLNYVYLVFNNVDKDKITTGDYLKLKKNHDSNVASTTNEATFRVVDIIGETTNAVNGNVLVEGFLVPQSISAELSDGEGKFFVKIKYDVDAWGAGGYIADLPSAANNAISSGSNNGAVWEVSKYNTEDLDIFFEVGDTYAIRLDVEHAKTHIGLNNYILAYQEGAFGNLSYNVENKLKITSIDGAISNGLLQKQFLKKDAYCILTLNDFANTTVPQNTKMKILKDDGSFVTVRLAKTIEPGQTEVWLYPEVHPTAGSNQGTELPIGLPWFNCYSFGNGVESDTIRDDFNETQLWIYGSNSKQAGFKSQLAALDYEEVTKKYDIIFSQIYNEQRNSNRFNEFLSGKDIVKKLNPDYGSIQKLFSRNNDLLAFCETKCLRILSEKDAIYNADGGEQLLSRNVVLGQAIPFAGDYGISKNPESFAVDEYRIYFSDKNRGAILRLSMDGITPISNIGMRGWVSDRMISSTALVGSFDSDKEEYNLTFHEVLSPGINKNVYTISFNEATKGWTSFKSYIQESGVTLNNAYFTFKNGYIWRHNDNTVSKNNFYGNQYESSINLIFNPNTGIVKDFKTVNYEGTQARNSSKKGWYIDYINTDLQEGKALEFLNKEGKWFSAIKGEAIKHTNVSDGGTINDTNIDFSEISVQGLSNLTSAATLYSGTLPSEGFDLVINALPQQL